MASDPVRQKVLAGLIIDPSGCLLWQGAKDPDGYGRVRVDGRLRQVHCVMWELFEGPVPKGKELDHVKDRGCRYRNCASIAHLEPVTHRENMMRGDGVGSLNAAKTHCGTCGTPYDEANTYRMPSGGRDCRVCIRARAARYRARQKAAS